MNIIKFEEIIGKTFSKIEVDNNRNTITFYVMEEEFYKMGRDAVSGSAYIKQIDCNIEDITNSMIINAEEIVEDGVRSTNPRQ